MCTTDLVLSLLNRRMRLCKTFNGKLDHTCVLAPVIDGLCYRRQQDQTESGGERAACSAFPHTYTTSFSLCVLQNASLNFQLRLFSLLWDVTCPMKIHFLLSAFAAAWTVHCQLHPSEPAQYQSFPSLREQAHILDGWRESRLNALPELMKKYHVDAWLVSSLILLNNVV